MAALLGRCSAQAMLQAPVGNKGLATKEVGTHLNPIFARFFAVNVNLFPRPQRMFHAAMEKVPRPPAKGVLKKPTLSWFVVN
jgi:hypothetical protein